MAEKKNQAEYWDGEGGDRWVRYREQIDRAIGVFGERALEQLAPQLGERVIDVGCGAGTTSLALAEAVGAQGAVLGVDVSEALLNVARKRCAAFKQLQLLRGDAGSMDLGRNYDLLYSRFGVMFFDSPTEAFGHLRAALRAGGSLSFVCWQGQEQNPWSLEPLRCILPFLDEPPPAPEARAPGPFAFADPEYIEEQLSAAGFGEIEIRDHTADVVLGTGGVQGALDFSMQVGPAARLTTDLGPGPMAKIHAALGELFQAALEGQTVSLPGSAWAVSARG